MPSDTSDHRDTKSVREARSDTASTAKRLRPTGRRAMQGKLSPEKSPSIGSLRKEAVYNAWKQESELVRAAGSGTRSWKPGELSRLRRLRPGETIKGYEGHHMYNVKHHPRWAGDHRNIEFVTEKEHLARHPGNFHKPTTGKLIDREKMIRTARRNRQQVRYAKS